MNDSAAVNAAGELAEKIAAQVLELVDRGNTMPIILIDGRSNSGKSTLAAEIQNLIFKDGESAPRVVHMDDLYLGWNGLQDGVDYLTRFILKPLSDSYIAQWREFDWENPGEPGYEARNGQWREFQGGTPLIIEGCGALNQLSAQVADIKVWLEVPQEIRHERWLAREGSNEHWAEWAAQEEEFYAREKSRELATITKD
jgi:pantothenate kinase